MWKELFRAADSFEPEEYFLRVLSKSRDLLLEMNRVPSSDGCQFLSSLKSLTVQDSAQVSDLSPLVEPDRSSTAYSVLYAKSEDPGTGCGTCPSL